MKTIRQIAVTILLSASLLLVYSDSGAQERSPEDNAGTITTATTTQDPVVDVSLAKILPLAANLKEKVEKIDQEISSIVDIETLTKNLNTFRTRLSEIHERLKQLTETGNFLFEQIAEIRSQTRQAIESTNILAAETALRLQKAEQLRQKWQAQGATWASHKSTFAAESSASIIPIINESEKLIANVLKKLEGIESPLVDFQRQVVDLQQTGQKLLQDVDNTISLMRRDLFRRSRPAMFTPTFIREFDQTLWNDFWLGIASVSIPPTAFYNTYGWILGLQLILILSFSMFFRRLNLETLEKLKLGFLVNRYLAAGFLPGILLPIFLYERQPRLINFIFTIIVIISAARLMSGIVESIWRRRMIYLLAALYLILQLFNIIALPAPFFRIFIVLISFTGCMICFWRSRTVTAPNESIFFFLGARIGGMAMLIIFISQVAGYSQLANHLLDIVIKTVFIFLLAWMSCLILRGALEAIFDNKWVRKSKLINTHHQLFIKKTSFVIDIIVYFFAASAILATLGIADNTLQASNTILQAGISFHGNVYSIGLAITAIAAVYITLFTSWILQRILDEEVYPRKKVERGVAISINRLIQYTFIVIAISLAFSSLGIGMQNLTVIIGAFGIGIGFGLQNIVNNFASGLILLFERSVKVGDVVVINGEWGIIKNLGLRATVVETFNHSEMIVPNSDLVSTMVTNWTLSDRQVRIIVKVGVAYGSDTDLVSKTLYQVANENPYVMKAPEPAVLFLNFGDSSLDFELRVWVADIDNMLKIKNELNREIDRLFRENGIEIPFSQHDLHVRTMDTSFKESIKQLVNDSHDSQINQPE